VIQTLLERSHSGIVCTARVIKSHGDTDRRTPLHLLGTTGVFTQALEKALLEGAIDAAVHSAKDLPSTLPGGFVLAAVLKRGDPRDCLLTRQGFTLDQLPRGATVGTGSPRRRTQLSRLRPDLSLQEIRGNVDTRRFAALSGTVDAVVLAMAGLARLGLLDEHVVPLPVEVCLPQAGQAALALEVLESNEDVIEILRALDDEPCRMCLEAERAVLEELSAGCQAPVAAHCTMLHDGALQLRAYVAQPKGAGLTSELVGDGCNPRALGIEVASQLRKGGAEAALQAFRAASSPG